MNKAIWHHMVVEGDRYAHCFRTSTSCYCEPEIENLGTDAIGIVHKVLTHQDLTRRGSGVRKRVRIGGQE